MTDAMTVCRQCESLKRFWNFIASTLFLSAREQIWVNPSFQEQLVLFELCQYNPDPSNGVYQKWRLQLEEARRRESAQRTSSRARR